MTRAHSGRRARRGAAYDRGVRRLVQAIVLLALAARATPAKDEPAVEHRLPFPAGVTWTVFQGNEQGPSHHDEWNRWAFDWSPMPVGSLVCATADGVVDEVKEDTAGPTGRWEDNNVVRVRHADGTRGEYVHLRKDGALVEVGDRVVAGDVIGWSGHTGNSAQPHLHFGLRAGGDPWPSVPCRFADVKDGVPKRGDATTSRNVAARNLPDFRALRCALDLLAFCEEIEVPGAALPLVAAARKSPPTAVHPSVDALSREADAAAERRREAGLDAARSLAAARAEEDLETLARLVAFGTSDFAGEPVAKEIARLAAETEKTPEWVAALAVHAERAEFRKLVAAAAKAEAAAQARFRPPEKVDPAVRPDFAAAIVAWTKAAAKAPSLAESSAIERRVAWLRRCP